MVISRIDQFCHGSLNPVVVAPQQGLSRDVVWVIERT